MTGAYRQVIYGEIRSDFKCSLRRMSEYRKMLQELAAPEKPDRVKCYLDSHGNVWSDQALWEFKVECPTILPEWFSENQQQLERKFRIFVEYWSRKHIVSSRHIPVLSDGVFFLKDCEVDCVSGQSVLWLRDSTVQSLREEASVLVMEGSSFIKEMSGNTVVDRIMDLSVIGVVKENAKIGELESPLARVLSRERKN